LWSWLQADCLLELLMMRGFYGEVDVLYTMKTETSTALHERCECC
jgi:hypothetical protein